MSNFLHRKELGKLLSNKNEALAGIQLQAFEVKDLDLAAAVIADPLALQRVCDRSDACSLNAQKVSQKLVRQLDLSIA